MERFQKTASRGFTLLELMIAGSITLVLVGIASSYMYKSFETNQYIKVQGYMRDATQRFVYYISKELAQSRRVFSNNTSGNLFKDKLPITSMEKSLAVFPTVRPNGSFVQTQTCDIDAGSFIWPLSMGNSIMFVKLDKTKSDYAFPSSVVQQKIDLYQFSLFFVKNDDTTLAPFDLWNSTPSLRPQYIVEWKSKYYADYSQFKSYMTYLSGSGNVARMAQVVSQLSGDNVIGLLDTTQTVPNDAFYNLTAVVAPTKKASSYKIEEFYRRNPVLLQSSQDLVYSVAYNKGSNFPIRSKVPMLYEASPSPNASTCGFSAQPTTAPAYGGPSSAFPGGFEIGITGPNSGRAVHINATFVGRFKGSRFVEQQRSFNAYARDY